MCSHRFPPFLPSFPPSLLVHYRVLFSTIKISVRFLARNTRYFRPFSDTPLTHAIFIRSHKNHSMYIRVPFFQIHAVFSDQTNAPPTRAIFLSQKNSKIKTIFALCVLLQIIRKICSDAYAHAKITFCSVCIVLQFTRETCPNPYALAKIIFFSVCTLGNHTRNLLRCLHACKKYTLSAVYIYKNHK